jgi:hypothetical protein
MSGAMRLLQNAMRSLLLMLLSCLLLASGVAAQREVGVVARIAEQKGKFVDQTSRAELWRSTGRLQVKRDARVLTRDLVRMHERAYINISFKNPAFETEAFFGSTEISAVGSYEIQEDTVGLVSGLQLVVKQGVMVVDHARGELLVLAAGIRTRIVGTTMLFVVDSVAGEGLAYLRDGSFSFPDYGVEAKGNDRVWRLRPGQAPVELFAPAADPARWHREVQYTTETVWKGTPFWQTPAFLIPTVAVVAGGIGCAAAGCFSGDDGPGTSTGSVSATIPE